MSGIGGIHNLDRDLRQLGWYAAVLLVAVAAGCVWVVA